MATHPFPYTLEHILQEAAELAPVNVPFVSHRYHLGLGISNRCNFACPICYYHGPEGKKNIQDMPITLLRRILANLPQLASIIFGLEGEALLHPEFMAFLELAARHADTITLITNGSRINEELAIALAGLPAARVFISIDAPDAALYETLRPGGSFVSFKRNAMLLSKVVPCVLHATVFQQNLAALRDLPELAAALGIKNVSFQQLRVHPGSRERGIRAASRDELKLWLPDLLEKARENDVEITLDRFFGGSAMQSDISKLLAVYSNLNMPPYTPGLCEHAENLAGILSDGALFPCAGDFAPVPLQNYSFDAIFNHPYLQYLRALHRNRKTGGACEICMNMESGNGHRENVFSEGALK